MNWKNEILKKALVPSVDGQVKLIGYRKESWGWVASDIDQAQIGNEVWQNSAFQSRLPDRYSTTAIETELLELKIKEIITENGISKDMLVMDAGCADGRLTHMFLSAGLQRIVSADLDIGSITRLNKAIAERDKDRVLLMADDFARLPIEDQSIDAIFSYGLFGEMPSFEAGLKSAIRMLKSNGILVYADPVLEHALIYALVRGDLDEFIKTFETSTRSRMWNQKNERYKVYSRRKLESLMACPDLELIKRDGISIFPSLVFGGVLQDVSMNNEQKEVLRNVVVRAGSADIDFYRQVLMVFRKK